MSIDWAKIHADVHPGIMAAIKASDRECRAVWMRMVGHTRVSIGKALASPGQPATPASDARSDSADSGHDDSSSQ